MSTPLAERIRPQSLDDYIGQQHLVGKEGVITKSIQRQRLPSMIFWGPPGVGKTTLAEITAQSLQCPFHKLSAISSGVKDLREVIDQAKKSYGLFHTKTPILFIDEIHRFSKSQQDALLAAVEKGWICLLGATTENPSFEVIPALLSRCQVYVLESFSRKEMEQLLHRAMIADKWILSKNIELKETEALLRLSSGDGRRLLNIFELLIHTSSEDPIIITDDMVMQQVQQNTILYDKLGEQHYDIASALIKSIRGSDPNAAVYWLARMIEGGEDVKFIARRLLILASEDIGNANPTALVLANNTFQAVTTIGYPESRIILSQCVVYLATSPKSNASYKAINMAQQTIKKTGNLSVPLHLRNAPTPLMNELGYGEDYKYAHNYSKNFTLQEYLPKEISETKFYNPGDNMRENTTREFLKNIWGVKYDY